MRRHRLSWIVLLALAWAASPARSATAPHHDVRVLVTPSEREIEVDDLVALPPAPGGKGRRVLHFLLHAGLDPASPTPGVVLERLRREPAAADFGLDPTRFEAPRAVPVELWSLTAPRGTDAVALSYGGRIDHPVETKDEDYARSFGETPGTVASDGVFLSGTSYWLPWFGDEPFAFRLEVALPVGWDAVSQGERVAHERGEETTTVVWDSPEPQTEAYLVAARFVESSRKVGAIEAMAFLRSRDDALAAKYLDATERYLRMYEGLLGPYPYPKFALVENFWETGYGMPSFTLLGSKVIRLPFILNSSYPHEILHNWWGNGVYVDYSRGNWCEGLTAYLADHLLQEQSGDASEYRQTTLQKYADYVSKAKDFPLAEFRERHSPATEAVGYGKALMLYHELRQELGDETFAKGLKTFYETNKFRKATFDDMRRAFEEASGRDLAVWFAQAVDRAGAPRLALSGVDARQEDDGWIVSGAIEQTQAEGPFAVSIPLVVTLEGRDEVVTERVALAGRRTEFSFRVTAKPLRVDADPSFDVFRRLAPAETPPALTRAFGSEKSLAVLPSEGSEEMREAYRALVADWAKAEPGRIEVKLDREVLSIPTDRAVWLFGWENHRAPLVIDGISRYASSIGRDGVRFGNFVGKRGSLAAVAVASQPEAPDQVVAWIAADRPEQVPGLGRKLPHYHKYSYLAFEGDEPTNVAKGRWPVVASPLTVFLENWPRPERGGLAARTPLASPPPAFSPERIASSVGALASAEMDGRAPGSTGHDRAATWVAAAFRDAGLAPAGETPGAWTSTWETETEEPVRVVTLTNVLGKVAGSKPEMAGQVIVVGAHYDHLGRGWPDAKTGNAGKLHPGADDNASGVAALVELARAFAEGPPPDRTILFAAFDGEEAGRLGSRRLVEALRRDGADVRAMINLDTVGRLGAGKILVLGTGTATEWVHVFRGAGFVTGFPVESVANDPGGSDQVSFHEAGIPAVQLFTGPHIDYHTPADTADHVDAEGIAKVAAIAREAIEYLAGRAEPLTTAGSGPSGGAPSSGRKVSLGTIPEFAFPGPGVKLDGVVPGSPAEKAGLAKGDVIVALGENETPSLKAFSDALKTLQPGQRVTVRFVRDGETKTVEAEVVAR